VSPASCSTFSTGTENDSHGAWSGMIALGRMNAPAASSRMSGVPGEDGLEVRTTLAKWVGTPTLGGEPITSWV
jgi:hypothetical protein